MELSLARTPFQIIAAEVRAAVGDYAWKLAVRTARQQGANARQAIEAAVHRLSEGRQGPVNYRNRKRDISGGIKPLKLNFEESEPLTMNGEDINFRRSKVNVGKTRKRSANEIFKNTIGQMKEVIFRWQSVSKSMLGPGRVPIGFGYDTTGNGQNYVVPFHMMSLTTHPVFKDDATLGCVNKGMARMVYRQVASPFAGHFGYQWLTNQDTDGVEPPIAQRGNWQYETGIVNNAVSDVFHKYTDIRLNLYGSTLYPLTYRVMVIKGMPIEMQPFEYSPVSTTVESAPVAADFPIFTTSPLNEFIMDHVRPLVSNPITGSNSDRTWKDKFKVVKDISYHIPCMSYGNAVDEGTSTVNATNVRNVSMFIRHDKFVKYNWRTIANDHDPDLNLGGQGWTRTDISTLASNSLLTDLDREQRMFLVISCVAPRLEDSLTDYTVDGPIGGPTEDHTNAKMVSGSYDIVVRNCFRDGSEV